jgi:hypothetical protein
MLETCVEKSVVMVDVFVDINALDVEIYLK